MDIESLSEKYQLTQNETAILTYINEHRNDRSLSIREVAKKNYSSPSSIVAMCKKMEFSGYSELLYYIVGAKNLTFSLHQHDVVKQYGDPFSQLLTKHRHSYLMILSSGLSTHIANYIADYFNTHGFRASAASHLKMLRPTEKDSTLVLFISNSGETKRLIELAETARTNNLDSVSFTGNATSQLASKTTLSISSETNSGYSYQEYYPQLFFGTCLNTFELLMSYTLANQK